VINILKNELKIAKMRNQIEASMQKKEKLMVEKDKLEKEDEKTIEKKARELGMAKPGETIIRIREEEKKPNGE
jgi:cell division protein FtsB